MTTSFVHLNVHSEYAIVDGLVRIKSLIRHVRDFNMPAVALTDETNLFGAVKFYKTSLELGIKPILGADVWLKPIDTSSIPSRLTLLCQNQRGYQQLMVLISKAYQSRIGTALPLIEWSWLDSNATGLIALSGAQKGAIGHALREENTKVAQAFLERALTLFDDRFYLEIQRIGAEGETQTTEATLDLAAQQGVPVVATNAVRFLTAADFTAHEARVCIQEGHVLHDPKRISPYTPQQYLRSAAEMQALFADIPEALANTVEIAKRCTVIMTLGKSYLPRFPVPEDETPENFLTKKAASALENYLDKNKMQEKSIYHDRLQLELDVINRMGFASYFLIVADFIHWSRTQKIMVGPGRGSGAGSLVAFVLGITTLDPIPYDLLFERFLNPERISMPDFDIDFCMEGRDRVIDYVATRYGRDHVAQIITYGSMAARAVVRDVGRVLGYPYGFVDAIAKLIPFELGMTLEKALMQEELLKKRYEQEEEVQTLIELARKLEGLARNVGKHAGGVVIAPTALTEFCALYCETAEDAPVTQFDKDDVEAVGLVKFDFLGLRTLTIMDWTLQTVNQQRMRESQSPIRLEDIPLQDEATYRLLKSGQTTAVFQLESRGMKDLIGRLKPDCFEDIVALVALYRPGPLESGMVDDFIQRKQGLSVVYYPHPDLTPILKPTYGVILYQEQVMQIAQVLAGYTLGGADLLRRAMGKKKPEEMAKQREIFLAGAAARQVSLETANSIFDLMEKFAGYGFNKSHSAVYGLIAYQTAWLKAHYPAAFMAAVLSSDMDHTEKVVGFIQECKAMRITLLPPHVNHSRYHFTVSESQQIIHGLGAIKGVGENSITAIVQAREAEGAFRDLFDFCRRVSLKKINRKTLEALIRAGAMDQLGPNRATLFISLNTAVKIAEKEQQQCVLGQQDLFAFFNIDETQFSPTPFIHANEWPAETILQGERETLGFYLSGHPIDDYRQELNQITQAGLHELAQHLGGTVRIGGLIQNVRTKLTKRGDKIAFVTLDDGLGVVDLVLFKDVYQAHQTNLIKETLVIVEADVSADDYTGGFRLLVRQLHPIDHYRARYARYLRLSGDATIAGAFHDATWLQAFKKILQSHQPGTCKICFEYQTAEGKAQFVFGDEWKIKPTESLRQQLKQLQKGITVEFLFRG